MKENQRIEWKESWRDEYLKWICGFANAEGGVLVIGRNDKGAAVGVVNAKKLLVDIPNKVRDILGIMVDVNLRREGGKELVEIVVEPYPTPISYKGEYHYRSGSTKQELKGAALERFLLKKRGRHWDDVAGAIVHCAVLQSRSDAAVQGKSHRERPHGPGGASRQPGSRSRQPGIDRKARTQTRHLPALLRSPRAVCERSLDQDRLLRDGRRPALSGRGARKPLRAGGENARSPAHEVSQGLHQLPGLQRRERFLFPDAALREALLNAVVHKDYSSGIPVQISVYDDRIVFWNPGDLPEHWTLKELLGKHPSRPFNPLLANAFFRAGYIESWGRGIEKIHRECREHGIEPPVYDFGMAGLMLTFRANPAHLQAATQETTQEGVGEKVGEKGRGKRSGKKLTANQQGILELLFQHPKMAAPELAEIVGISERKIEQNIATLKKIGQLKRIGPAKGGHWEVLK